MAELRGFNPLTSAEQAPVRGDGAAASKGCAPLDPTLAADERAATLSQRSFSPSRREKS